jgi:hypothetical protein
MHGESFAYSSYTSVLSHLKNAGHDIASENTIYKRKCMHIDHECLETLSCVRGACNKMKGMSCFIRGKGNKVKWNSLQSDESITKRIVSLYIYIYQSL